MSMAHKASTMKKARSNDVPSAARKMAALRKAASAPARKMASMMVARIAAFVERHGSRGRVYIDRDRVDAFGQLTLTPMLVPYGQGYHMDGVIGSFAARDGAVFLYWVPAGDPDSDDAAFMLFPDDELFPSVMDGDTDPFREPLGWYVLFHLFHFLEDVEEEDSGYEVVDGVIRLAGNGMVPEGGACQADSPLWLLACHIDDTIN